ncbi:MAG: aminoglycoside phosphotransferase family protein [Thermomicrobiales bacterium]
MSIAIPTGLAEDIERQFGDAGRIWLADLPILTMRTLASWSLIVDGERRYGAHGIVLPVRRGPDRFALKIAYPDAVTADEIAALQAWAGHGTVGLVEAIPDEGILLMDHLDASRDLTTLPLDEAAQEAGRLTHRLAIVPPPNAPFQTTADRAAEITRTLPERWAQAGRPFPTDRLHQIISFATYLADTHMGRMATWDLHSANILWKERTGWTMIDPMPLIGDPELALAPFLWTRAEEITGPGHLAKLLKGYVASGRLNEERTIRWLTVRLADYWLWGAAIGLTIDPERCRRLLAWLAPLLGT